MTLQSGWMHVLFLTSNPEIFIGIRFGDCVLYDDFSELGASSNLSMKEFSTIFFFCVLLFWTFMFLRTCEKVGKGFRVKDRTEFGMVSVCPCVHVCVCVWLVVKGCWRVIAVGREAGDRMRKTWWKRKRTGEKKRMCAYVIDQVGKYSRSF